MTAELIVVLPVLGRPHRAAVVLQSLANATSVEFVVRVMATRGDSAQAAYQVAIDDLRLAGRVDTTAPRSVGDFAAKVNVAYRTSNEPFLFLGADDLDFKPGWWEAARACFEIPVIGVVGTNDLAPTKRSQAGEHSTHCVVRRAYADQGLIDGSPGILYEGYLHEFVDDELVGTAKKRGAWVYAADSVVEHLHPHWNKAPLDASYRQSEKRMHMSRRLFRQRSRLWT